MFIQPTDELAKIPAFSFPHGDDRTFEFPPTRSDCRGSPSTPPTMRRVASLTLRCQENLREKRGPKWRGTNPREGSEKGHTRGPSLHIVVDVAVVGVGKSGGQDIANARRFNTKLGFGVCGKRRPHELFPSLSDGNALQDDIDKT